MIFQSLQILAFLLIAFPATANSPFHRRSTDSALMVRNGSTVTADRRLVSSKSSKSSDTNRKGTGDSNRSRSKRNTSTSRDVARSPSASSSSRPRSDTKMQSRRSRRRRKPRKSETKKSGSKSKTTKKSRSNQAVADIVIPRGSTFAPTFEPTTLEEMTPCDATMRKCGRERRPIYTLDLME
jgi:hypothetical protein